ncbi:HepT-like ribonuclease domain-containing protein [Candidatus Chloroploca mongolica]|uniref:HepT-like ribonuclease domain-containing protein n=1 Tax=Candidatus Chloroploca mongolica TaxID=2528176 RepID=UPI0035316671
MIRQLEIIGEAVKQLSEPLRRQYPHLPWRYIAGMRDKLIHHYFRVDLDQVWLTATGDVPVLQQAIEQIIVVLATQAES